MKTLPKQTSLFTEEQLTSLPEDSPVNHTQWQASDLERKMSDTSGQRCLERFGKFSRHGLWAKTFSALLIGQEGWYSTKCRLIWKLKGTKYNRMYFQLAPSTLHIEETGFGLLLKTPTKMDGEVSSGKSNPVSGNSGTLAQEIMSGYEPTMQKLGLLPTPTAMDSTGATANMKSSQVKEGSMHSVTLSRWANTMLPTVRARAAGGNCSNDRGKGNLEDAIAKGMLPTPMASDCGDKVTGLETQDSLVKRTRQMTGKTSQLSPQFVLEMMGFPTDWTLLPFLSGEMSQSKPEAMQ